MSAFNSFSFRPSVTQIDDRLVPSVTLIKSDLRTPIPQGSDTVVGHQAVSQDSVFVGGVSSNRVSTTAFQGDAGGKNGDDSSTSGSGTSASNSAKLASSVQKKAADTANAVISKL